MGVGWDEGMRGSQKFEDRFEELMGNWSESSFPARGQPPVCLSAPICSLGVKLPLGRCSC